MDYDYIDSLSPEDREFLAKFTDEYYGGAIKVGRDTDLHYSDDDAEYKGLRSDCYNRNNRINRDIFGLAKATDKLDDIGEMVYLKDKAFDENELYDEIDRKLKLNSLNDPKKKPSDS